MKAWACSIVKIVRSYACVICGSRRKTTEFEPRPKTHRIRGNDMIIADKIRKVRVYSLLAVLSLFMFMVGISFAAEIPKPGEIIGADNVDKYKEILPFNYIIKVMKENGVKVKVLDELPADLKLVNRRPPKEMIDATEKYSSSCKLTPGGGLTKYIAGFPFSEEEIEEAIEKENFLRAGEKIGWNMTQRCFGDDYTSDRSFEPNAAWDPVRKWDPDAPGSRRYCIDKYGNVIISDQTLFSSKCIGRVHTEPMPVIPGREHLLRTRYYYVKNPRDIAGQQILLMEYLDAEKNDDLWLFIPSIRRIKRMPTSQRAATRTPTDYNWDESWGWGGKNTKFNWRFIKKEKILIFLSVCPLETLTYDKHWFSNAEFYMDDVYVVECISKDPFYSIPKKIWYITTNTYFPVYFKTYNKAGEEWKNYTELMVQYKRKGGNEIMLTGSGAAWCDLLSGHRTFMPFILAGDVTGVDPLMYTTQHMYEVSRGQK